MYLVRLVNAEVMLGKNSQLPGNGRPAVQGPSGKRPGGGAAGGDMVVRPREERGGRVRKLSRVGLAGGDIPADARLQG